MRKTIYSSYKIFSLWVLLCYQCQTHEIIWKHNDILFHPLLILKIPFSKEIFHCSKKFEMAKTRESSFEDIQLYRANF